MRRTASFAHFLELRCPAALADIFTCAVWPIPGPGADAAGHAGRSEARPGGAGDPGPGGRRALSAVAQRGLDPLELLLDPLEPLRRRVAPPGLAPRARAGHE